MLTSATDVSIAVKALQLGAHDYLEKSFADGIALRRGVENAMDKARIQRELDEKSKALTLKNQQLEDHILRLEQEVTDRLWAEQELKQARDQALAASSAKDEFLARLSHELRTPLSPVLLLASEASSNPNLNDVVRADFQTIRKNIELEARLIDDLLDITRISRGNLSLNMHPVDLHTVLSDAVSSVRSDVEKKRISLDLNFDTPRSLVNGDAVRLQQIFWNLLSNAVKFTPVRGTVKVSTQLWTDGIEVVVEDNGIGLSKDEIARIFDAFSQGEHSWPSGAHQYGGLGLGLAISRMLVEMHHGEIYATSAGRDQGAQFRVRIPGFHLERSNENAPPASASNASSTIASLVRPLSILLVEDHQATRNALKVLLSRRGHNVTVAACVAEARTTSELADFDIMISDIGLPDGNGYDLMQELHQKRGIKAIALTGYGMDGDIARSASAGFLAHLTKPVHIQDLEAAIAKIAKQPPDIPLPLPD